MRLAVRLGLVVLGIVVAGRALFLIVEAGLSDFLFHDEVKRNSAAVPPSQRDSIIGYALLVVGLALAAVGAWPHRRKPSPVA